VLNNYSQYFIALDQGWWTYLLSRSTLSVTAE